MGSKLKGKLEVLICRGGLGDKLGVLSKLKDGLDVPSVPDNRASDSPHQ